MPGSDVSTRSSRSAASAVPSATTTMPRVDRVADPDAAAVVDADPRRARGHVHERVEDRPVGDRVGAVPHRLRLAVRRGDRAGVEVVAPDHHRRLDLAAADELVDRQPRLGAGAVAEPADPRRQPLERDPLGRRASASAGARRRPGRAPAASRRWPRCRPGRRTAQPSGTARRRGRTAAGYRPGRSPGMRTRPRRRPLGPPLSGCCHNRKHSCLRGRTRAGRAHGVRSTHGRDGGTLPDRTPGAPRPPRREARAGRSRSAGRARPSGR